MAERLRGLTRTKQKRFLPYSYSPFELDFEVSWVLDGDPLDEEIDADNRKVGLEDNSEWETLTADGVIRVPDSILEKVLPSDEREVPPLTLFLVQRCEETYFRKPILSADVDSIPSTHSFEADFERERFRGTVMLKPYLARSESRRPQDDGFATDTGSKVASAREWKVSLDRGPAPGTRYLRVKMDSFEDSSRIRAGTETVCYMDFTNREEPILWINEDKPEIVRVLRQKGYRGVTARTRDIFYDWIAQYAWQQLFLESLSDLDEDGETRYPWQNAVLNEFLSLLYPELEPETRRQTVFQAKEDWDKFLNILSELDLQIQEHLGLQENMEKLVGEIR